MNRQVSARYQSTRQNCRIIYEDLLQTRFGLNVLEENNTQLWFLPTVLKYKELKLQSQETQKGEQLKREDKKFFKMYNRFANILMESPVFEERFEILILTGSEKKHIRKECMDGDKSIKDKEAKDIIAKAETCAYARGRSLIIFVGKMLRLGVSLPCVDIALHFDPITSVDIIYQSIFRVLTERDDKKKGFLIDLNKERFINFMYEMNNYETKAMKRQDIESKKQKMISKLFLYNLNGINTYFDESEKHANLYNLLAKSLSVDNDERFSEKLIQETLFKNFQEITNASLIKPLYKELKKLGLMFGKGSGTKIKKNLYDRKENKQNEGKEGKENTQENSENNNQNETERDESIEENRANNNQNETERDESDFEKNKNDIVKNIYNWVISLFAIHILFDEDNSKNSNSNNAFDNSCGKKNIEIFLKTFEKKITSAQIEKICEEEKYVLDCHISKHLNLILNWDELKAAQQKEWVGQEELNEKNIEILETYKNLFKKYIYDKLGEIEKQTLINIYCNIKDNFVMLTNNISRQSGIIKNECSESLFSEKQQGGGKEKQSVILNENVLSLIRKYLTVREDEKSYMVKFLHQLN